MELSGPWVRSPGCSAWNRAGGGGGGRGWQRRACASASLGRSDGKENVSGEGETAETSWKAQSDVQLGEHHPCSGALLALAVLPVGLSPHPGSWLMLCSNHI